MNYVFLNMQVLHILAQTFSNKTSQSSKVLLISGNASKINPLASYFNSKGYAVGDDNHSLGLQHGLVCITILEVIHFVEHPIKTLIH